MTDRMLAPAPAEHDALVTPVGRRRGVAQSRRARLRRRLRAARVDVPAGRPSAPLAGSPRVTRVETPAPLEESVRRGPTGAVILTTGLSKTYAGGVPAVDSLDLEVGEGEIFALLGPNGAGKTTTVGMLTGRVVPTAGKAIVNGVDVVEDPALAKAKVGVVAQANTLDRGLNVWENLYFHARYFGYRNRAARAATDELLERFRLTARARADIATLSGGMTKRLMLARAFLPRPAVVFLDEPTAGLDPQSRLALWEILRELHAEGETIVLTTHYMEEAERLAQRVAIMDRGRLLALDTAQNLRRSLGWGGALVVEADGDLDRLAGRVRLVPGVLEAEASDGVLRVSFEQTEGKLAEVVAVVTGQGHSVRRLSLEETSLETVFIKLTGKDLRE